MSTTWLITGHSKSFGKQRAKRVATVLLQLPLGQCVISAIQTILAVKLATVHQPQPAKQA